MKVSSTHNSKLCIRQGCKAKRVKKSGRTYITCRSCAYRLHQKAIEAQKKAPLPPDPDMLEQLATELEKLIGPND